jgi:hypothetical protein
VFELRAKGLGYRSIAVRINKAGHLSPSGGTWSYDSVRIVLGRAEVYSGDLIYGRRHRGKYITMIDGQPAPQTGKVRKNHNPIRVDDSHPPIISREIAAAVIALRTEPPKRRTTGTDGGAPLAGLLFCGRCGKPMYAQSLQRKAGQKSPNYICSSYHQGRENCGYCFIPQKRIHHLIGVLIADIIGESKASLRDAIQKRLDSTSRVDVTASLQTSINKLAAKISAATDRILTVSERLVPDLERRVLAMHEERQRLESEMSLARQSTPTITVADVLERLHRLDDLFTLSNLEIRAELTSAIESITLDFEHGAVSKRGQSMVCTGIVVIFKTVATPLQSNALLMVAPKRATIRGRCLRDTPLPSWQRQ